MPALSVADVLQATGGGLLVGDPAARITSYSIDTRQIEPGGAFFALVGTRTDGHAFVADALQRGAAAAVVARVPEGIEDHAALALVADTQVALERLGRAGRRRSRARIVGITGSVVTRRTALTTW